MDSCRNEVTTGIVGFIKKNRDKCDLGHSAAERPLYPNLLSAESNAYPRFTSRRHVP
jgi:hypothetical protein